MINNIGTLVSVQFIKKIKKYFLNIHIIKPLSKSYQCAIYGCNSKYKKNLIDIIATITQPIYIESGQYYFNFYRFFLVITVLFKIIYKYRQQKNIHFFVVALRAALLYQTFKFYKSKIVITYIDNDEVFQLTAQIFEDLKFFCIQNGARGMYNVRNLPNLTLVNFFCFSKFDVQFLFQNGYKANRWMPIGNLLTSIFLTKIAEKNNYKKEFDICLVSQWRNEFYEDFSNNKEYLSLRFSLDSLLDVLNKYLRLNPDLKICIALCSDNQKEFDLFKKNFPDKYFFGTQEIDNEWSSYEAILKSRITLSVNSTMLSESLELNSIPIGYNPSNDPFHDASLPDCYLVKTEDELINKLNFYLFNSIDNNQLFTGNIENSKVIPACEVIKNAVKFVIDDHPEKFENYLDEFSVSTNSI